MLLCVVTMVHSMGMAYGMQCRQHQVHDHDQPSHALRTLARAPVHGVKVGQ